MASSKSVSFESSLTAIVHDVSHQNTQKMPSLIFQTPPPDINDLSSFLLALGRAPQFTGFLQIGPALGPTVHPGSQLTSCLVARQPVGMHSRRGKTSFHSTGAEAESLSPAIGILHSLPGTFLIVLFLEIIFPYFETCYLKHRGLQGCSYIVFSQSCA